MVAARLRVFRHLLSGKGDYRVLMKYLSLFVNLIR